MNQYALKFKTLFLTCVLAACTQSVSPGSPQWNREEIGKLRMQLIDPTAHESLWFSEDGTVTADYGTRESMVGTILSWRLSDGRLEVYNDEHVVERFSLVSMSPDTIVVKDESGKVVRYRRHFLPERS